MRYFISGKVCPIALGLLLSAPSLALSQERLQTLGADAPYPITGTPAATQLAQVPRAPVTPGVISQTAVQATAPTTSADPSATQPLQEQWPIPDAPQTTTAASAASLPGCGSDCCPADIPRVFGGGDYIILRPHFSEAVGFAMVTDTLGAGGLNRTVTAEELDFSYQGSMRLFLGYHLNECTDFRVTYWYVDTDATAEGIAGAGQTIVDPFGNTGLTGSSIQTSADIKLNVFDAEYQRSMQNGLAYSAGLRFADVTQFYDSHVFNGQGVETSTGVFNVDFFGVGPYLSLSGSKGFGSRRQVSLFAKGAGALLVGQYDISNGLTIPGQVVGTQLADRIRTIPVLESELGITWEPESCFKFTAGWMFQAWMNIGTSGGTFNGQNLPIGPVNNAFGGADDADIMSFDGIFLRGEVNF